MIFKPLRSESPGTIYRLLSASYGSFLGENPRHRETWQLNWREYDADVSSGPATAAECGFFSYAGDELVGFASYDPRGGPAKAVIGHNCILPGFRGKGYGRRQLRELLRILKQRGFKKAVVTTGGHEFFASAIRMYKSCGFKETGNSRVDAGNGSRTKELEYDLTLNIRRAGKDDFESVLALFRQLWPENELNRERQLAVYHAMLETNGYELLCAERRGKVLGFSSLSIQPNFWQKGRIAYITTLIVDRACRNQGRRDYARRRDSGAGEKPGVQEDRIGIGVSPAGRP